VSLATDADIGGSSRFSSKSFEDMHEQQSPLHICEELAKLEHSLAHTCFNAQIYSIKGNY